MKVVFLNCVSIICFTALAIIFKHWWIVLFAMLFMFQEKTHHETKRTGESEDNNDNPRENQESR